MLPLISNIFFQDDFDKYYKITFKVSNPQVKLVCIQEENRNKTDNKRIPRTGRPKSHKSILRDNYDIPLCEKEHGLDKAHSQSVPSSQDYLNVYGDTCSNKDDWIRRYISECEKSKDVLRFRSLNNQIHNFASRERVTQNSDCKINESTTCLRFEGDSIYSFRSNSDSEFLNMRNTNNCTQISLPVENESSSKDIPTEEITSDEKIKSENEIKSNHGLDVQHQYTIRIPDNCKTVGISLELAHVTGEEKQTVSNSVRPTSQLEQRIFDSMEKSSNVLKACNQLKVTVHESTNFDDKEYSIPFQGDQIQTFREPSQLDCNENLVTLRFNRCGRERSKSAQNYSCDQVSYLNSVSLHDHKLAKRCKNNPISNINGQSFRISQPTNRRILDARNAFEMDFRTRLLALSKEIGRCLQNLNDKSCEENGKWKENETNREISKMDEVEHTDVSHHDKPLQDSSSAKGMHEKHEVRNVCNDENNENEKSKKENEKISSIQSHDNEVCDTDRKSSVTIKDMEFNNDERIVSKLLDGDVLRENISTISEKLISQICGDGERVLLTGVDGKSFDGSITEKRNLLKSSEKMLADSKKRQTRSPVCLSANNNDNSRSQSKCPSSVNSYVIDNIMALNRLGFHSAYSKFKVSTKDVAVQVSGYPTVGLIQKKSKPSPISRPECTPLKSLVKLEYSKFLIHFALPVMHVKYLRYKPWSSELPCDESSSDEEFTSSADGNSVSSGTALVRLHNDIFQIDFELQDVNFQHVIPKASRGTLTNAEDWVYVKKKTSLGTGKTYLVKVPMSTYVYEDPMKRLKKDNIIKRQIKKQNYFCKEKEKLKQSQAERISKEYCASHPNSFVFVENEYVSASMYGQVGIIELLRNMEEDMKLMNSIPQEYNVLENIKLRNSDIFKETIGCYPHSVFT